MKRNIYLLPVIILLLVFTLAFKGGNGFTIEVNNSFAVALKASESDNVAERLQVENSVVKDYFKENSLVFIAVSSDTKTQIRISRFADNFSGSVYDSENLSDEKITEIVSLYGADAQSAEITESGGRKFAVMTELLKDSGGVYTSTQYVTVAGGKTYIITCYNPGEGTSEEVEKIFSTFYVRNMDDRISSYESRKKWILPAIIAMCAVVGVSVIGLCKKLYIK